MLFYEKFGYMVRLSLCVHRVILVFHPFLLSTTHFRDSILLSFPPSRSVFFQSLYAQTQTTETLKSNGNPKRRTFVFHFRYHPPSYTVNNSSNIISVSPTLTQSHISNSSFRHPHSLSPGFSTSAIHYLSSYSLY